METPDARVAEAIALAWADAEYPGDDHLAGRDSCCGEYGYVTEFFRGRHWREITLESLKDYAGPPDACLSFMSGAALRYYLPAFMLIALEEPLGRATSNWEMSLVDVAATTLNPPRYRPEVHALEQTMTPSALQSTSPEATARLRTWWDDRMQGFRPAQRDAIVAFLTRMQERRADDEGRRALAHWSRRSPRSLGLDI
jgi:hypothetical protein